MNIFEMASQNSDNLKRDYYLLKDRCEDQNELDILSKFTRLIKDEWTISINMGSSVLNNFLIAGTYMNIYKLKKETKKRLKDVKPEASVETAIKKHLKDYYRPRTTFDRSFQDGERFKYGALTIGGLGLRKYGEYCVVIKRKQSEDYVFLAFIGEDSLSYVEGDQLDTKRLSKDVADRESVHYLAALKHKNNIESIPADEWASFVCCDQCYIETVTTDDILNTHIKSIRMSKKDYYLYHVYLYMDYLSELPDFEKYKLYEFKNMQELSRKQGIKLEVIEE